MTVHTSLNQFTSGSLYTMVYSYILTAKGGQGPFVVSCQLRRSEAGHTKVDLEAEQAWLTFNHLGIDQSSLPCYGSLQCFPWTCICNGHSDLGSVRECFHISGDCACLPMTRLLHTDVRSKLIISYQIGRNCNLYQLVPLRICKLL